MCKFNVYDVSEIQENLEAYLKLLKWIPAATIDEEIMREARISHVKYLIDKCDDVIEHEKIRSTKDE
jgi:hypothetical protein